MIDLIEILYNQHFLMNKLYITWDAASWHHSLGLNEWIDEINEYSMTQDKGPEIELIPLPSCSQFLNVIETVFSTLKQAVIFNSNYQSEFEMKWFISKHFQERNGYFRNNPRRAGKKIWDIDFFSDFKNIKSGNYRKW
jgi:transposase